MEPAGLVTTLTLAGAARGPDANVHWALLVDPHITSDATKRYLGQLPEPNLQETATQVLAAKPDFVLFAGDLSWTEGLPEDYLRFRTLINPIAENLPICLALGNHDNRLNFWAAFSDCFAVHECPEKMITVIDQPPLRLIVLDSLYRTDIVPGLLGKAQRTWLREFLESSGDAATFLCVHHPLDDEDDSLLDAGRLLELVQPFRNVKAIFHGHDHLFQIDERDGIWIVSLPAIGFPFEEAQPVGWVDAQLTPQGGTLQLQTVAGEGPRKKSLQWRR